MTLTEALDSLNAARAAYRKARTHCIAGEARLIAALADWQAGDDADFSRAFNRTAARDWLRMVRLRRFFVSCAGFEVLRRHTDYETAVARSQVSEGAAG